MVNIMAADVLATFLHDLISWGSFTDQCETISNEIMQKSSCIILIPATFSIGITRRNNCCQQQGKIKYGLCTLHSVQSV